MKSLHISANLELPLDTGTQKIAFLGRTGGGKTYAAQKLAEEMWKSGIQFVVLDPVGVWYGLRIAANGKDEGIGIPVFGGLHGDIPIEPTGGALMADIISDRNISAIIDVSQFETDAAKNRFAETFAQRFFFRRKSAPAPVFIFIEECQEFIPENPMKGEQMMLHAFTRLGKIGRNYGIGVGLISQRPQEVNKKVLNMTECMFAFQMTGPHERKTIAEWVKEKGASLDIVDILPRLEIGQAHVWSPQWLRISETVKIDKKWTFNASSTPVIGGKRTEPRPLDSKDMERIREAMAETIDRSKANDPRELKKKIADLEAEREHLTVSIDTVALEKEAENRGYRAAQEEINRTLLERIAVFMETLDSATDRLRDPVVGGMREAERLRGTALARMPPTVLTKEVTRLPENHQATKNGEISNVSASERKILTALAQSPKGLSMQRLSFLAGYTVNGHFNNMIGALRGRELITPPRVTPIMITPKGEAVLDGWDALPVGRPLREFWVQKVGGSEGRILRALIESYPNPLTMEELASRAGYTVNGHFNNMVGHLRSIGLMTPPRTPLRASEELF